MTNSFQFRLPPVLDIFWPALYSSSPQILKVTCSVAKISRKQTVYCGITNAQQIVITLLHLSFT